MTSPDTVISCTRYPVPRGLHGLSLVAVWVQQDLCHCNPLHVSTYTMQALSHAFEHGKARM